jgi:alanine-alpha-ketoisovalerate/valine-pyruvate aminotransferase
MILLHPHKVLIKIIMKKMLNQMIKAKRRAMIKGELSMMGIKEKHHHIQECIKMFKEITLSTTYLVISKKVEPLDHVLQIFMSITRLFLLLSLLR